MFELFLVSSLASALLALFGCVVLWRKYAYFTDGFAHASTLAAVISISMNLHIIYPWVIVSCIYVLLIRYMLKYSDYNSSISLVTSFFLAISVIISNGKGGLGTVLFGKLSDINTGHIKELMFILCINLLFFMIFYKKILIITLSKEIAHSSGIQVNKIETLFLILLALSVVVVSRIVGSFFVINLILIPALISKMISKSPLCMLCNSVLVSIVPNLFMFLFTRFLREDAATLDYIVGKFSSILIIVNIVIYLLLIIGLKIKNSLNNNG